MGIKKLMKTYLIWLILFISFTELISCCKPYINNQKERMDFENFIAKYNITYRTQKAKEKAFEKFISKKGAIYTRYCINRSQCPGGALPLTSDAGVTKFFDLTDEQFKKHLFHLNMERKEIDKNFLDFDFFLKQNFNKTNINRNNYNNSIVKSSSISNSLKKQSRKAADENSNDNNFTNLIYFDLRNNELIKSFNLFDVFNSNEKNKKKESEIELLINKATNSFNTENNKSNFNNNTKENLVKDYKRKFNFLKLIDYLEKKNYYVHLFNEIEETSEKLKSFYSLIKFKSNKNLEFLLKNVGPVYVEINTSGLTFYEKGIFNPFSCEMKSDNENYMGVILIGYGKEGEFEYWIAKSFLGDNWGEEEGYFRILKKDDVDIFNPKSRFAIALNMSKFDKHN